MKLFHLLGVVAVSGLFIGAVVACSSDDSGTTIVGKGGATGKGGSAGSTAGSGQGGGTAGQGGGTAGQGGGTAGQGGGTAGSGGGSADCSGFFQDNDCGKCGTAKCCTEAAACKADSACTACLQSTSCDPTTVPTANTLMTCINSNCATECGGATAEPYCQAPATAPSNGSCVTGGECNPVTGTGCEEGGAGWTCDLGNDSAFHCFEPPNDVQLCGACDNSAGPFCAPTMGCVGKCARYCCDDGDCGGGKCDKTLLGAAAGLCVTP